MAVNIEALPDVQKDASIHRYLASQKKSSIQHKRHRYLYHKHTILSSLLYACQQY